MKEKNRKLKRFFLKDCIDTKIGERSLLNNGRVVVEGRHEDLLVNSGEYRNLYYSE